MRKERISETIGNIDQNYVNEATAYTKEVKTAHRSAWMKWGTVAACLVLICSLGIGVMLQESPNDDGGMLGISMEDREPIVATITELKDEGLVCTVVDPDNHEFITEGYSVLILFSENTKVSTLDGNEFQYDRENPNAKNCGLPVGTTIKIFFTGVNYKADGMAHSLDATEIIPYEIQVLKLSFELDGEIHSYNIGYDYDGMIVKVDNTDYYEFLEDGEWITDVSILDTELTAYFIDNGGRAMP